MADFVLEAEYTNDRQHTAFMTGQICCKDGGAGTIKAELFDPNGKQKTDLAASAHQRAESHVSFNTLTTPVPPRWSVKCYRLEMEANIETKWAEID